MENLIYSSIYISDGRMALKIIKQTGLFEKKYISTDIPFEPSNYENINDTIHDVQTSITKVMKAKSQYEWEIYDFNNIRYLSNVTIFEAYGRKIIFTNINESSIASLLKKINKDESYINLNSLDKYTILIDPYIEYDYEESKCHIIADIYSENGTMYGKISKKCKVSEYISNIDFAKLIIQETLVDASSRVLIECNKKDIVVVSNNAYLYEL